MLHISIKVHFPARFFAPASIQKTPPFVYRAFEMLTHILKPLVPHRLTHVEDGQTALAISTTKGRYGSRILLRHALFDFHERDN